TGGEYQKVAPVPNGSRAQQAAPLQSRRPTADSTRQEAGSPAEDKLATYRKKRRFDVTSEPAGSVEPAGTNERLRFCVQKHAASRLHYDFRVEMDGVLRSWAVPKGPTLDPREKRLAMQVEDHPVEYLEFEGTIPKGEYGGGTVMLWDLGTYEQRADSREGDFKLILRGQKLAGEFALVRMKDKQKEWLLIKKTDQAAGRPVDDDHSVKSGRTMEQIATSDEAVWLSDLPAASAELDRTAMPEVPMPASIEPMLATAIDKPFSDGGWLFEPKWDGIRCIAFVEDSTVRLMSRRGRNITFQYPELQGMRSGIEAKQAVLDGEIVAYDDQGLPSFHVLQQRMNLDNRYEIERMQQQVPVAYQVFDLLYVDGRDIRALPLVQRKALLQRAVKPHHFIFYSGHVEEHGEAFFRAAERQGLEGIVAKLKSSPYSSGKRTRWWLKLKTVETIDCVIGGWTDGSGAREALGALALGLYRPDGKLQYVTNCGSGFDQRTLRELLDSLEPIEASERPFVNPPDPPGRYHWVEPRCVCEVKYSNWTPDGHLRHPVFLHLRPDKAPEDCILSPD
ncbi:MAG: non-homologous end-joining DNA ligase, partial [Chloroflexota bacterium]|nr:non-homologous end-joining DNA ligase [Chloroflexota bacterium]